MKPTQANNDRSDEVVRHALDGTAMLFVGSGLGFLAKASSGERLPNGRDLANLLHAEMGIDVGRHNLQRISQYAFNKLGPDRLLSMLRERLKVSQVDERLKELYRAPWQRIYTTNYDDAIEVSRRGESIVSSFTLRDSPMSAPRGAVVHLNGFIDSITPDSFAKDAVLTDISYSVNEFQDSDWSRQFLIDIRTSRSILFVGYGNYILDVGTAWWDRKRDRAAFH